MGMFVSLTLFSCGEKSTSTSGNEASAVEKSDKTSAVAKTPEEYAALKCEYLTKEKAAKDAGNKDEKKKFDNLGDELSKEVEQLFKNDTVKKRTFLKLVHECRKGLNQMENNE